MLILTCLCCCLLLSPVGFSSPSSVRRTILPVILFLEGFYLKSRRSQKKTTVFFRTNKIMPPIFKTDLVLEEKNHGQLMVKLLISCVTHRSSDRHRTPSPFYQPCTYLLCDYIQLDNASHYGSNSWNICIKYTSSIYK